MTPIHRWTGAYVGFLADGWFHDANGRYLGWYEEDATVWGADGCPLGTIVDGNYVLRDQRVAPPVRRTPRVPPVPPTPTRPPGSRIPRIPVPGWVDALEQVGRRPLRDELVGEWRQDDGVLHLLEDGRFVSSRADRPESTGSWQYRGDLITTPDGRPDCGPENIVYRIIEFTGGTLTLRRLTAAEHNLPFTLHRSRRAE